MSVNTIDEICREIWLAAKDWEPRRDSIPGITRIVGMGGKKVIIGIAYVRETFVPYIRTNGNVCFCIADDYTSHIAKTDESLVGAHGYPNAHQASDALRRIIDGYGIEEEKKNGRY